MFKFYVQIYDHEACHLIKQVITKLKAVSYRPFSLCRPKVGDGFPCYVCFCLTHRGLATLADYWLSALHEVRHHDEDPLRKS